MPENAVLQSWKEISAHVRRTERTLQRWEQDFGFPVRRPSGKQRSAVIAVVSEIDEWMRSKPSFAEIRKSASLSSSKPTNGNGAWETKVSRASTSRLGAYSANIGVYQLRLAATVNELKALCKNMRELIAEQRRLREELSESRKQLSHSMHAG